jgi:hypothetical protein
MASAPAGNRDFNMISLPTEKVLDLLSASRQRHRFSPRGRLPKALASKAC